MGKKCLHGRQEYFCKDCGGGGICEHEKRRTQCKIYGGSSFCKHGKQKYTCKDAAERASVITG